MSPGYVAPGQMLPALLLIAAASSPLTLVEAFDRASHTNLSLRATRQHVPVVEAGVRSAGMLPNPTLSLSYGLDDPRLVGGISMNLPFFGQRGAAIASAQALVPVAQADVEAKSVELHANVRRLYCALVTAQARVLIADETAVLAKELADLARLRTEAGGGTVLDVEQAALAFRRLDAARNSSVATRDAARPALNTVLGDAPDAAPALPAELELPTVPPLPDLLARLDQHPAIVKLEAERAAARTRANQGRVDVRPAPDASLELSTLQGAPGGVGIRGTIAFGVPILSQNQGPIAVAEAEAAEAEANKFAVRADLESRLRSAWTRLSSAVRQARFSLDDAVPSARRVEAMARLSYREGKTPLIAVLQAQTDTANARGDAADAANQAQQALADLEEATGVSFH